MWCDVYCDLMVVLTWNWTHLNWAMDLARWRYHRGQGWQLHAHRFRELFWIERGRLRHQVGDAVEELGPGCLRILQADEQHVGTALCDGTVLVNVSVSEEDAVALEQRVGLTLWRGPALHRLAPGKISALARLVADLDPGQPADRDLILLHLDHLVRLPSGPDPAALPARLTAGLAALAAADEWRLGVIGWARRSGVTREHLSRAVSTATGATAAAFLLGIRLHAAARALAMDDRPIAEVAAEVGFVGHGHFAVSFRREFGASPAVWRRERRLSGPGGAALRAPPR